MKYRSKKFKSGGLHEKHIVATWCLGNRLSIRLQTQGNQETQGNQDGDDVSLNGSSILRVSLYF